MKSKTLIGIVLSGCLINPSTSFTKIQSYPIKEKVKLEYDSTEDKIDRLLIKDQIYEKDLPLLDMKSAEDKKSLVDGVHCLEEWFNVNDKYFITKTSCNEKNIGFIIYKLYTSNEENRLVPLKIFYNSKGKSFEDVDSIDKIIMPDWVKK